MRSFDLILLTLFLTACTGTQYSGPTNNHFDGKRFLNLAPQAKPKSFLKLIKWQFEDRTPFPDFFNTPLVKVANEKVEHGFVVTFINHATTLIQLGGINILTDPIWSDRASPVQWAGPHRVTNPAIRIEDLPPIDVIILSHNHYDHMDLDTLNQLAKAHQPTILMGLGNAIYLNQIKTANKIEMDWWEHHQQSNVAFHFTPVQHWSKRRINDTNKALWGGFVIKSSNHSIYFAGDTGYADHFIKTKKRLGSFDLSLLPIGAYEPRWFMKTNHMNPEEAVLAHIDLESKVSMGIHFRTFQLTNEGIDVPEKALRKALEKQDIPETEFMIPKFGQVFQSNRATL